VEGGGRSDSEGLDDGSPHTEEGGAQSRESISYREAVPHNHPSGETRTYACEDASLGTYSTGPVRFTEGPVWLLDPCWHASVPGPLDSDVSQYHSLAPVAPIHLLGILAGNHP